MSAEIVDFATAWRRLPESAALGNGFAIGTWPGPADSKDEEVEVLVRHRPVRWRYTKPCPEGASHWRPVAAEV